MPQKDDLMKLGAMNNPKKELLSEISAIASYGFEFIDLTLEKPNSYSKDVEKNLRAVKHAISASGLEVVGHTSPFFPTGSAYGSISEAVASELKRCIDVFEKLGAKKMNIHPSSDLNAPITDISDAIEFNANAINEAAKYAKKAGIAVLVENMDDDIFGNAANLEKLLGLAPDAKFHLDIGHANIFSGNLKNKNVRSFLKRLGGKLAHVHVSDNNGRSDLHLPIGAGNINWNDAVKLLKNAGYDGTITLEIFSKDKDYLKISKEKFERLWRGK